MSDPQKKEIYDQYGEEGLSILESGMFGEEGSVVLPFIMKPHYRGMVFLVALLLVCIIVLVPIFIVLKTDNAVHWNWGAVFVPIWILLALFNFFAIALIFIGNNTNKLNSIKFALQSVFFTLFFAFLCARLDDTTSWDPAAYLSPLYAIEALNIFKLVKKSKKECYMSEAQGGEGEEKRSYLGAGYGGYLFRVWFWWGHRIWFLIFLTVQLHYDDWSWWIPAIPLLTAICFGFIFKIADDKVANDRESGEARGEEEEGAKGMATITTIFACILGSLAIISLALLATHLDNGKYTIAVVLIPLFIVLG